MNFSVNENSGPPKIVHLPFGLRLEKGCRPLLYTVLVYFFYVYLLCASFYFILTCTLVTK